MKRELIKYKNFYILPIDISFPTLLGKSYFMDQSRLQLALSLPDEKITDFYISYLFDSLQRTEY